MMDELIGRTIVSIAHPPCSTGIDDCELWITVDDGRVLRVVEEGYEIDPLSVRVMSMVEAAVELARLTRECQKQIDLDAEWRRRDEQGTMDPPVIPDSFARAFTEQITRKPWDGLLGEGFFR